MSSGETFSRPFSSDLSPSLQSIEILERPIIQLDGDVPLRIFAVGVDANNDEQRVPVGFVSTKSGRSETLDEFSGESTGTFAPCIAIKGFVKENIVYNKNVYTDLPFSGIRMAIALRRAARIVKKRLK